MDKKALKFAHISDLHIGKKLHNFSLIEDQKYILNQIIDKLLEQNVDVLLVAGDVYDTSNPTIEAMDLFDSFITRLFEKKIKTFIIPGNHDSAVRLSTGSKVMKDGGVYIAKPFGQEAEQVTLEDDYGKIQLCLLPFIRKRTVTAVFPDETFESCNDAISFALKRFDGYKEDRSVLVCHQFVANSQVGGSEETKIGGEEQVSASLFDGFNYVALGHIHKPQMAGGEHIRYCGTPLKYSVDERNDSKKIVYFEIGEDGVPQISFDDLSPLHDVVRLQGTYQELMDKSFYSKLNLEDYYYIVLTDEEPVYEAGPRLKTVYKNLLNVTVENRRTAHISTAEASAHAKDKSPLEYICDFYKQRLGEDMSQEQKDFVKDIIESLEGDE